MKAFKRTTLNSGSSSYGSKLQFSKNHVESLKVLKFPKSFHFVTNSKSDFRDSLNFQLWLNSSKNMILRSNNLALLKLGVESWLKLFKIKNFQN